MPLIGPIKEIVLSALPNQDARALTQARPFLGKFSLVAPVADADRYTPDWGASFAKWRDQFQKEDPSTSLEFETVFEGQTIWVPDNSTLLIIESSGSTLFGSRVDNFLKSLRSSEIQEVRIRNSKGKTVIYSLMDEVWTFETEAQTLFKLDDPHWYLEEKRTHTNSHKVDVLLKWSAPSVIKPLSDVLQKAQKKIQEVLTLDQLAFRLTHYLGRVVSQKLISREIRGISNFIPIDRLHAYAIIYELDFFNLIASSNQRYSDLTAQDWSTDSYPIYIYSQEDYERLLYFKEHDPHHVSLGWYVFAARKNPYRYSSLGSVSWLIEHGIQIKNPHLLELNQSPPHPNILKKLSRAINMPLSQVILMANETYFGTGPFALDELEGEKRSNLLQEFQIVSIHELVQKLFPGQIIYPDVTSRSKDMEKIIMYARDPHLPGRLLFAARNVLCICLKAADFAQKIGVNIRAIHDRELRGTITKENLYFWIEIFRRAGIPISILGSFIDDQRLLDGSSAQMVTEHLDGISFNSLRHEPTELTPYSLAALQSKSNDAKLAYEAIVNLASLAPGLPVQDLAIKQHPELLRVFPELITDSSFISVPQLIREIAFVRFNMAEFMVSILLDDQILMKQFADRQKISEKEIYNHIFANVQTPEINFLISLASFLSKYLNDYHDSKLSEHPLYFLSGNKNQDSVHGWVSPNDYLPLALKILYLHFYPEVLKIFPTKDKAEDAPHLLNPVQYAREQVGRKKRRLGFDVREDLQRILQSRMKTASLPQPKTLKEYANFLVQISDSRIQPNKALLYLYSTEPQSYESILLLQSVVPEINFKAWYENVYQGFLAYFLGYSSDGQIDYSLPEGWDLEALHDEQRMSDFIITKRDQKFTDGKTAKAESGLAFLEMPSSLRRPIARRRNVQLITLAKLAQALEIDRRLIYWFFKKDELMQVLELSVNDKTPPVSSGGGSMNVNSKVAVIFTPLKAPLTSQSEAIPTLIYSAAELIQPKAQVYSVMSPVFLAPPINFGLMAPAFF